jgi:hypothetical protein
VLAGDQLHEEIVVINRILSETDNTTTAYISHGYINLFCLLKIIISYNL